jgi:hypothetical protein
MAEEQEPRLYSKQQRAPVDEVAGEHLLIHSDLERWGRWQRERYQQGMCSSLEKRYDSSGGREPSKAIVSLPPDSLLSRLEWVITLMLADLTPVDWSGRYLLTSKPRRTPESVRAAAAAREIGKPAPEHQADGEVKQAVVVRVEQLGETIVEYYAKREAPKTICWKHALRYEDFAPWMFECRTMVLQRLAA